MRGETFVDKYKRRLARGAVTHKIMRETFLSGNFSRSICDKIAFLMTTQRDTLHYKYTL